MNAASVAVSFGGIGNGIGAGAAASGAGLYTVNIVVDALKSGCEVTDPFEEMQNFITEYVKAKIEENNQEFVKADINDDFSTFILYVEEYLNEHSIGKPWNEKKMTMDDVLTFGGRLYKELFEPDATKSVRGAMGISFDVWQGFMFDVAMHFSLQYISVQLQKLANYNELYYPEKILHLEGKE